MNKQLLLVLGLALIGIGLLKPNLSSILDAKPVAPVSIAKPNNTDILDECEAVTRSIKGISPYDAKRLASLYMDIANLIELDNENEVVKNTDEIRQANSLAGAMLRLNIKGKYPELPEKAKALIVACVGDDNVPLNSNLRTKAVEAFRALAWACNEGNK